MAFNRKKSTSPEGVLRHLAHLADNLETQAGRLGADVAANLAGAAAEELRDILGDSAR